MFCLRVRFEADGSQLEDWMFRFFVFPCSSFSNSVLSPACLLSGVLLLNCQVDSEPRPKKSPNNKGKLAAQLDIFCVFSALLITFVLS